MNLRRLILLVLALTSPLSAQEKPSREILGKLQEAYEMQEKQQYSDALQKLDEVEAVMPNLPALHNMRGAIYLKPALRDFDKAQALLDKALALEPGSLAPRFNQCELLFVKHEWAAAAVALDKVLADFPKLPQLVRHLTLYKRLICEVQLGQTQAAEKTLKENFTFMDDTPAYYFCNAAIAYGKKDEKAAKEWLSRAEGIYKQAEILPYMDGLMEARWVPNIALPLIAPK